MNKSQLEIPGLTLHEIMNGKKSSIWQITRKLHYKLNIDGNVLPEVA